LDLAEKYSKEEAAGVLRNGAKRKYELWEEERTRRAEL
jgi:hypothetical protein